MEDLPPIPVLPPIAVLVVTYQRPALLAETLAGLAANLIYPGEKHYIIADDGSEDDTRSIALRYGQYVRTERGGMGANTNAGLHFALERCDLILQLQDDMRLLAPLDLTPHARRLLDSPADGFIRLWGVAAHSYRAYLDGMYWRVDWASDELYIASDRPHLKHRRFHLATGFYPEGLRTDATEDAWCHQAKDAGRAGGVPHVLVPHALDVETTWEHTGYHERWRDKGL